MNLKEALARALTPLVQSRTGVPDWPLWQQLMSWSVPPESLEFPYAFKLVPSVYFCISLIQDAIASVPLRFYVGEGDGRRELTRAPGNIVDLWSTANALDTGYDLQHQIPGSLLIQGNAYIYKRYLGSKVRELWCLAGDSVSPVPGPNRSIAYYKVDVGAGNFVRVEEPQIVQIRMYAPDHGVLGYSPLGVLQLTYQSERDSMRWLKAFYEKGGTVAGHYSTEHPLGDGEIARLEKSIRRRFQGPEHAWDPVILPKKLVYTRAGLTLEEMQFIENAKLTREQIFEVFKIPPQISGQIEGSGLNSEVLNGVMTLLVQGALLPLATRISSYVNEKLLKSGEFGPSLSCDFDFSGMPVMQHVRLTRAKMYNEATGGPIMTRELAQQEMGLPVSIDPGVNELLTPNAMQTATEKQAANDAAASAAEALANKPLAIAASRSSDPREHLRARAGARLSFYQRMVERGTRSLFSQQMKRVIAALETRERMVRIIDAEDLLKDPQGADRRLVRRMKREVTSGAGSQALADIGLDVAFDLERAVVAEFIRDQGARMLTDINATTLRHLREELAQAAEASESFGETVARVRGVFRDRRANAVTIARTETIGPYNFGSIQAWKQSGVVEQKQWLTAQDDAVRDWHAAADGQSVPLDASFSVGPDTLEFPGDPRGAAGNIINCRCTVEAVVVSSDIEMWLPPASETQSSGKPGTNGRVTLEQFLELVEN